MQLVRATGADQAEGHPLDGIDLVELHPWRAHAGDGDDLVRELAEAEAFGHRAELPLQVRLVEDVVLDVQVEPEPQRLECASPEEDHLVEPSLVDVDDDLFSLRTSAHGGKCVSSPVQEAGELSRHQARVRRRCRHVGRQIERAAVDVLEQRHVAVEHQQRREQQGGEHSAAVRKADDEAQAEPRLVDGADPVVDQSLRKTVTAHGARAASESLRRVREEQTRAVLDRELLRKRRSGITGHDGVVPQPRR